jgi:hypothetical protein
LFNKRHILDFKEIMAEVDKVVLDEALGQQDHTVPFQQKRWQEITDQNASNGAFTGQLTFDLSNLSSMNQWANLAEGYFNFPVKFSMKKLTTSSGGAITGGVGTTLYGAVPKGGYHSFVDSVSITVGSTNIQSANIYQNVHTSFKMLSEWSEDELRKYGPTLGVAIDDYRVDLDDGTSNGLTGIENSSADVLFPSKKGFTLTKAANDAFEERSYATNVEASASSVVGKVLGSNAMALGKNSCQVATSLVVADNADVYVCYALATVRLKDISDAIAKLPPMKSVKGMLTINYNAASCDLTYNATGTLTGSTFSPLYGRTMPAMLIDGFAPTVASGTSTWRFTAEVSAVKSGNLSTANPPQNNARLYVPVYVASPEVDRALSQKKTIRYRERYQTTITVEPNTSWSGSISAGVQNPRRLTLSGYFVGDPSAVIGTDNIISQPLLSPFSHEGWGTSPFAAIRGWQVELAGRPVFQQPIDQDFHAFMEEIAACGLNGGQTEQMGSGLLSQRLWAQLYRYYTCDLSRRIGGEDGATVSVNTSFTNATQLKVMYIANLEQEKEITVDTQYGVISQGL